jgi:hypothetical protein
MERAPRTPEVAAEAHGPQALAQRREQRRWERVEAVQKHELLVAPTPAEKKPKERG